MNRDEFKAGLTALIAGLIPKIGDDYRASDDPSDDVPGMQITIGADGDGWSYQTGDNSYTGDAYGYQYWGLGAIYRDSDPAEVAEELLRDLESQDCEEGFLFFFERTDRNEVLKWVRHCVTDDLGERDHKEIVPSHARLVGWQCGFEPMFVAVWSYLPGVTLDADEAEAIAVDLLLEKGWFADPERTTADWVL
jgi:hypothetical protein